MFPVPVPWNCSAIAGMRATEEPGLGGRPRAQERACEAPQRRC